MKIPIEEYKRKSLSFTLNIPATREIQLLMEGIKRPNKQIFVPYLLEIYYKDNHIFYFQTYKI